MKNEQFWKTECETKNKYAKGRNNNYVQINYVQLGQKAPDCIVTRQDASWRVMAGGRGAGGGTLGEAAMVFGQNRAQ